MFFYSLDLELFYLIFRLYLGFELIFKNNVLILEMKWKFFIFDKLINVFNMSLLFGLLFFFIVKIDDYWNSKCNLEICIDWRVIIGNVIWFRLLDCYYVFFRNYVLRRFGRYNYNFWFNGIMSKVLWEYRRSGGWFRGVCMNVCVCVFLWWRMRIREFFVDEVIFIVLLVKNFRNLFRLVGL